MLQLSLYSQQPIRCCVLVTNPPKPGLFTPRQDTLDKLLKGANFNFGSPMHELWERLQGGECSPRVARYAEGLLYLQKKEHTHRWAGFS